MTTLRDLVFFRSRLLVSPFETSRLSFRLPRLSDVSTVHATLMANENVLRWTAHSCHPNLSQTTALMERWLRAWEKGNDELILVLEDRVTGDFVGTIGLVIDDSSIEISYMLRESSWGCGLATEAVREVIEIGFRQLNAWRLWGTCAPDNPASQCVMERAGMQTEGRLRRWMVSPIISAIPRDAICLSMTRDEWMSTSRVADRL